MADQLLFGTRLPIIQAPMAGVQNSELAIAVANAGGLGSLPCGMLTPESLRQELNQISRQTTNPVNLNFFCHQPPRINTQADADWIRSLKPYYQELGITAPDESGPPSRQPFNQQLADIVCEFKPAVVSFHFGLPESDLLDQLRQAGCQIISSATTVAEAIWLEQHGVDAIIAQGIEAGGHRGMFLSSDLTVQLPLNSLLPAILNRVNTPVIAAGGICNPESVKSALEMGAAAVQVGTAYLLCHEATTSALHRQALKSPRPTALTNLFSGRPARGIVNRLMTEQGPLSTAAPEFPLASSALTSLRATAEKQGKDDFTPLWSGMNRQGCEEVGAAELTRMLASLLQL